MTKKVLGTITRLALWSLPVLIVVAGFVAAMPWLKQQNPEVAEVLRTAGAIFVVGYAFFISQRLQQRVNQRLDEVQLAHQGFANSRGWLWGGMAAALLLTLPPIMDGLVDLVDAVVRVLSFGSADTTHHLAVRLAFFGGVSLVMVMQTLGVIVAAMVWQRRIMGGIGER